MKQLRILNRKLRNILTIHNEISFCKPVLIATVLIFLISTVQAGNKVFEWQFGCIDTDMEDWTIKDAKKVAEKSGCIQLLSQKDSKLFVNTPSFSAKKFSIVEITMSSSSSSQGQIFFAPDACILTEEASCKFPVRLSSKLTSYIVNCSKNRFWSGDIDILRIDPVEGKDIKVNISAIRLFRANWIHCGIKNIKPDENSLRFVSGNDSMLISSKMNFSAKSFPIMEIVMMSDKAEGGQIFFASPDKKFSGENSIRFTVKASSQFQTYRVDCRKTPFWTGRIGKLRLDPVTGKGANVAIKSIRLLPGK